MEAECVYPKDSQTEIKNAQLIFKRAYEIKNLNYAFFNQSYVNHSETIDIFGKLEYNVVETLRWFLKTKFF